MPTWFRIFAVVLLAWGAAGCFAWYQQFRLGADAMGPADAYQRALYAALPVWYNAVYAVAVGTGFLGALALLARSVFARPLFVVALIAVIVQFGWLFATTDILAHRGVGAAGFPIVIVVITGFEIWLARHAQRRGWIA
ncbi:hypothetical protein EAH84_03775 [Sphingomonas oligophenolica]|uniref:Sugar transporter n=2 Tax=Sphingomonas oligophenolica TaxID=301154 RepID=A0A502CPL3_9SPHN|nr:hypothetical protein EAH84_03775 [Sphingomonas oligophenolica]